MKLDNKTVTNTFRQCDDLTIKCLHLIKEIQQKSERVATVKELKTYLNSSKSTITNRLYKMVFPNISKGVQLLGREKSETDRRAYLYYLIDRSLSDKIDRQMEQRGINKVVLEITDTSENIEIQDRSSKAILVTSQPRDELVREKHQEVEELRKELAGLTRAISFLLQKQQENRGDMVVSETREIATTQNNSTELTVSQTREITTTQNNSTEIEQLKQDVGNIAGLFHSKNV